MDPTPLKPLRWGIVSLLLAATLVNYIDRQTVSVLAPTLQRELTFSTRQYAVITSLFLITYALTMWLWGTVFDRIGNRKGMTGALGWWSLAEAAHALALGPVSLGAARAALGAGESGNWPGVTRTIAAWFAEKERALAMGIVNCGAALGSAIAAPLIVYAYLAVGWRATFVATALLGLGWVLAWLRVYPRGSERVLVGAEPVPLGPLVRDRRVWGIILGRFFGDPIWWLYLNWLPLYLSHERHFSQTDIGRYAWMPFAAAALGCLLGGGTSGWLINRGWSVNAARKTAIVIGTVFMPAGLFVFGAETTAGAIAAMCCTLFGFQFWVGNVQTLPSDLFPVGAVGAIAGISGSAAGLGSVFLTLSTGWVVERFSYNPILITAGILGPVATVVLFCLIGRIPRRGKAAG